MAKKVESENQITHEDLVKLTSVDTKIPEQTVDTAVTGYGKSMIDAVKEVLETKDMVSVFTPLGGYEYNKTSDESGEVVHITLLLGTDMFDVLNANHEKIKSLKEEESSEEKKKEKTA